GASDGAEHVWEPSRNRIPIGRHLPPRLDRIFRDTMPASPRHVNGVQSPSRSRDASSAAGSKAAGWVTRSRTPIESDGAGGGGLVGNARAGTRKCTRRLDPPFGCDTPVAP